MIVMYFLTLNHIIEPFKVLIRTFSNVVGFKRKCNFGRNQLKYASPEDSQLAEDFGISKCTSEIPGECCREDEICKCEGEVLEIFPPQCTVEPTYCEPKGKLISI